MPPENMGVTEQTFSPDNLYAGEFPRVMEGVTVVSGEGVLARGTVLGKITASGKFGAYDSEASNGLENPVAILAVGVDATDGDVQASVYLSGEFRAGALTGYAAAIKDALRALSIFVH